MKEDGGIPRGEFKERIDRTLSEMVRENIGVIYVYGDSTHPENLIYLTNYRPIGTDLPGHTGYNAVFLLERNGSSTLIIDRDWYVDWVKEKSWVEDIVADSQGDTLGLSYEILKRKNLLNCKIEADTDIMPASYYKRFKTTFANSMIDEKHHLIGKLRESKSPKEIELISKGLEILGQAHDAAFALAKEGVSEIDISLEIRRVILSEGAEYSTALFVDAGRRSTIALASPMSTPYRLKYGDMVLVSLFCTYKKYSAGLDRCWVVGEPSKVQRKLADIELKTLEKAISLVKPGVRASEFMEPVYTQFAEPLLKQAGFKEYNTQGYVGHGTGIQVVETPVLWKLDPTILKPGMIIDIEPGIYSKDPKIGGLRTADFVLVTEDGCKVLTKYPRRIGTWA